MYTRNQCGTTCVAPVPYPYTSSTCSLAYRRKLYSVPELFSHVRLKESYSLKYNKQFDDLLRSARYAEAGSEVKLFRLSFHHLSEINTFGE